MSCQVQHLEDFWHELVPVAQPYSRCLCVNCFSTVLVWAVADSLAGTYGDDEAAAIAHADKLASQLSEVVRTRSALAQGGGTA